MSDTNSSNIAAWFGFLIYFSIKYMVLEAEAKVVPGKIQRGAILCFEVQVNACVHMCGRVLLLKLLAWYIIKAS